MWLRVTEAVLAHAEAPERQPAVERLGDLRKAAAAARQHLAGWQPPHLSSAVGLREMTLTPEAAADLDALLRRVGPPGTPPPRPLRRLPEADPATVFNRTSGQAGPQG
jgi:hypothetical protein